MNRKQVTIYNKGREAFYDGKTLEDCPYKKEADVQIWTDGYIDADAQEAGETG